MGFFGGGGGGGVKMPAVQPAAPIPAAPSPVSETSDSTIRKAKRRSGYEKTIITGDLEPATNKSTILG